MVRTFITLLHSSSIFLDTVKDLYSFQTPSRHLPDTLQTPSRHPLDTLRTPHRHLRDTLEVLRQIHSIFKTSSLYPPYTSKITSKHIENLLSVSTTIQTPSRRLSDTLYITSSQLDTIQQQYFQVRTVTQWTEQQKSRLGHFGPSYTSQQSFIYTKTLRKASNMPNLRYIDFSEVQICLRYPNSPFSPSQDSETTDERAPNHGQDIYNLIALFIDIFRHS